MSFLIDAQLSPARVERLASAGHQAVRVFPVLKADASRRDVAARADACRSIPMTKDEDFIDLLHRGPTACPVL